MIDMRLDDSCYDLVVTTPVGVDFTTKVRMRDIIIVMQRRVWLADFTVLLMRDFDVIFGMDWITRHRALIDLQKKKVQLQL